MLTSVFTAQKMKKSLMENFIFFVSWLSLKLKKGR